MRGEMLGAICRVHLGRMAESLWVTAQPRNPIIGLLQVDDVAKIGVACCLILDGSPRQRKKATADGRYSMTTHLVVEHAPELDSCVRHAYVLFIRRRHQIVASWLEYRIYTRLRKDIYIFQGTCTMHVPRLP